MIHVYHKTEFFDEGLGVSLHRYSPDKPEPMHLHEFVEIVYIFGGAGVHRIDDVDYPVRRGDMLFINYRQIHSFRPEGKMTIMNVLLDPEWISETLIEPQNAFELLTLSSFSEFRQEVDPERPFLTFQGGKRERLENLLNDMNAEFETRPAGSETVLKAQVNILLTLIFREMTQNVEQEKKLEISPALLEYIRSHCNERLSLEQLSRQCFYQPAYFSRVFKEHFGFTLSDYILKSRMELAADLLANTVLPASIVAARVGFSDPGRFFRQFRDYYGQTPAEYRKGKGKK